MGTLMISEDKKIFYEAKDKIDALFRAKIPEKTEVSRYSDKIAKQFAETINQLIDFVSEISEFIIPLSQGQLNKKVPATKNFLASPFKELHSRLSHLTWQTQQIKDGDYSQRVDFMGDFSEAFNSMVISLAQKEGELKQKIAQLESANKQVQQEVKERKEAEKDLRKYERMVAASNDHMSLADRNYVYQVVNDAYLRSYNVKREDIVSHFVPELFGQKFFETHQKPMIDRCLAGEVVRYQSWIDFPMLGRRYMDIAHYPYFENDGSISGYVVNAHDITERKQAEDEREKLINEIQAALAEIKTLRSILPLCSFCKKIRDDKGYWEQVDVYIYKHLEADISHSICPECMKKHYPEQYEDMYPTEE
jgi:PAS domain S-box-containing protein